MSATSVIFIFKTVIRRVIRVSTIYTYIGVRDWKTDPLDALDALDALNGVYD